MTTPPSDNAAADTTETTSSSADEPGEPSSLEKGLDFTIGAALLTAETLEQVIGTLVEKGKIARENAPSVFETLMERGRPTREQWLRTVKGEILPQFKLGGPGSSERPAEEEIQTLEDRVATLEQQVSPTSADDAIAHEAVVLTDGDQHAPTQPAISEEITTGTPAEPQTVAPTEESDAATTGADTATDIEVGENASPEARPSADEDGGRA
jgi:polyhydroxyalkanoate synthesis regulator phasin